MKINHPKKTTKPNPAKRRSSPPEIPVILIPGHSRNGNGNGHGEECLSATDKEAHEKDETIISKGWETFIAVGSALKRIRDRKSYRLTFPTFEKYVAVRWGYGRAHAYRLIGGADIVSIIMDSSTIVPKNEAQVRPLLNVPVDQLSELWKQVEKAASGGNLTAALIKEVAKPYQPKSFAKSGHKKVGEKGQEDVFKLFDDLRYFIVELESEKGLATLEKLRLAIADI